VTFNEEVWFAIYTVLAKRKSFPCIFSTISPSLSSLLEFLFRIVCGVSLVNSAFALTVSSLNVRRDALADFEPSSTLQFQFPSNIPHEVCVFLRINTPCFT
jgi:hypothetical protein